MTKPAQTSPSSTMPVSPSASPVRQLAEVFENIGRGGDDFLSPAVRAAIEELRRKFEARQFFLVFLGQFKRGKSSLINALLGRQLLPAGILPLTSVVTVVRHGEELAAEVEFRKGSPRRVPAEDLAEYVTESKNPRNKKGVTNVQVFCPEPQLASGLCLVDTPGIGSIFEHNTQIAYDYVPQADAAIFVISPEAPLAQVELDFLHHLRRYAQKIFFVLNKADQASDAERTEILEFAKRAVREQIPDGELRFFAVSARNGLEALLQNDPERLEASGLATLSRSLDAFLAEQANEVLIRATAAALRRRIRDEIVALEFEEHARAVTGAELEEKIRQIEQGWEKVDRRHREAGYVLRGEVRALASRLEAQLEGFVREAEQPLTAELLKQLREASSLPKHAVVRLMEEVLCARIADILEDWKIREEQTIRPAFEDLTARFSEEAAKTLHLIRQAAAEQFGFTCEAAPMPEQLTDESRFRIKVEELTTWGLGRFPFLLPKRWFLRYLEKHLKEACSEELHRNAGRLRSDLVERLERSTSGYLGALDDRIGEAQKAILLTLRRAQEQRSASEEEDSERQARRRLKSNWLLELDGVLMRIEHQAARGVSASTT